MTVLNKRTTVYLEQELHQALRLEAAVTNRSISELINEMIREKVSTLVDLAATWLRMASPRRPWRLRQPLMPIL